jgi:hypothetical protein
VIAVLPARHRDEIGESEAERDDDGARSRVAEGR